MTKYYCDRCGKECEALRIIGIPDEKTNFHSVTTKNCYVCRDCENEFDSITDKLIDIKFILFDGFMGKQANSGLIKEALDK